MKQTRTQINKQIIANNKTIVALQEKNIELYKKRVVITDKTQRYEEKEEDYSYWEGRKKIKTTRLVGRRYWNQYFKDEDTGGKIRIERSEIIKIDGVWQ